MKHSVQVVTLLLVVLVLVSQPLSAKGVLVTNLRCEYKTNPVGIDALQPRLSWQLGFADRNVTQSAYQIRVSNDPKSFSKSALVWDSGKVMSDQSVHVVYQGSTLASGQRYFYQVRVWDQSGNASPWSDTAFWEMGLLQPADWKASWIQPDLEEDVSKSNPCPMLRKEFQVKKALKSARAYVTGQGLYEMELNGKKVGDQLFTPGWTEYDHHIQYQTYDVTPLLRAGQNAAGVTLGDGWFRGNIGFRGQRNVYGDKPALLLQMRLDYTDGTSELITSDASWKCATGPILMSDIYNGESYDARLEKKGWSAPGYDDSDWRGVRVVAAPKAAIVAPAGPPVRKIQELKPLQIMQTPAGETVYDMGQNLVGWIRLRVIGPAGTTITLRHAEVLDKAGNFYIENLRAAKQTVQFTLKGDGVEVFEPHFTFQGFRYVAVEGLPGQPALDQLTGVVIHSDYPTTGAFECSDPLLNQLQHNIQWGQKGNFLDVPTDCPQRDERLGWTGDAQVFARTACFNGDVAAFYTKWLKDVSAGQKASGAVPHVLPNVLEKDSPTSNSASAGWADAAVVIPWIVYQCYGDKRILEQQYPSMKAWVDYMANRAGDTYFWNTDFTFGDWLAFATTRSDYPGATTDKDFICQAYFARSTDLLQKTAAVLGKTEDANQYADLLKKIKKVFQDEFMTPNGRLSSNTQTAYLLALSNDLMPESLRERAAQRLAEDVNKFKHITTGFLGASLVCPVLTQFGFDTEAFMLLHRKEYPSWLYPVTKGATTIWERWDGIKTDGTFQNPGMNSFNHYAYGAIGEWLYSYVAGIELDPQNPGYKHIILQPHPGGELTHAKASLDAMYGRIASGWEIKGANLHVTVEIPANTTATVKLPHARIAQVTESGKALNKISGLKNIAQEGTRVQFTLGSGRYQFVYPMNK